MISPKNMFESMPNTGPEIQVACALIWRDGQILLSRRHQSAHQGGLWEFPGGKLEPEETIENCISRELKEELAISVKVGEELITIDHAYSHKKLRFVVHLCNWISGDPKPLASQQVRWVELKKLFDYPFPAANSQIIHALLCLDNIKKHCS